MAGGKGTRLWPMSRYSFPKQFLSLTDNYSFLQKTVLRFLKITKHKDILIITNQDYLHIVNSQLNEICPNTQFNVLCEPCSRNTGPAICLSVKYMEEKMSLSLDDSFIVASSDHLIEPEDEFLKLIDSYENSEKNNNVVIFGATPKFPETGYGYINVDMNSKKGFYFDVISFEEKPSFENANEYLQAGNYLWNCGIFIFKVGVFWDLMKKFNSEIYENFSGNFNDSLEKFRTNPEISIDYCLLEKTEQIKAIAMNLNWSDVGSWDSVYDCLKKDENNNVLIGNVVNIETNNCLVFAKKKLVSTIGLSDLIVVETDDALLISKKGISQGVKKLVELLNHKKTKEAEEHLVSFRPWGSFNVLEEDSRYKIKKIVVQPGQRLSLQLHYHRSEHWIVVKGTAKITVGSKETLIHENESIYIPKSECHRMENPGKVPLEIIEVQVGEYVGEDDIVRFQDDYSRK